MVARDDADHEDALGAASRARNAFARQDAMEAEKLGSGLVNVILGALILWVAQTTFQHSGELAGVDQKFSGLQSQQGSIRDRLDTFMEDLNNRTRSRFTREDGDKMADQIDGMAAKVGDLERRIADRLTELQLKVIALQTQGVDQRELSGLRTDLARLHATLQPSGALGPVSASQRSDLSRGFTDSVRR